MNFLEMMSQGHEAFRPKVVEQPEIDKVAGCQVVARANSILATDVNTYFYYTYVVGCQSCNIIYIYNKNIYIYNIETAQIPDNYWQPDNQNHLKIWLSILNNYDLQRLPDEVHKVVTAPEKVNNAGELLTFALEKYYFNEPKYNNALAEFNFYRATGHLPGDAWDGTMPSVTDYVNQKTDYFSPNSPDVDQARQIPWDEIIRAADYERSHGGSQDSALQLMWPHMSGDFEWWETVTGRWLCIPSTFGV